MKINYTKIRQAIKIGNDFQGNSCRGFTDNEGIYRIFSYQTEIYNSKDGLNLTYYSPTTSKIQGIIAEVIYGKSLKQLRKEREKEAQKIDYSQLYYDKEIRVKNDKIKPYPIDLDVSINDFHHNPDCQVGHFGYNFYFRTNKGIKIKRYKTRKNLERAVENKLKKEGFSIIEWINRK